MKNKIYNEMDWREKIIEYNKEKPIGKLLSFILKNIPGYQVDKINNEETTNENLRKL